MDGLWVSEPRDHSVRNIECYAPRMDLWKIGRFLSFLSLPANCGSE